MAGLFDGMGGMVADVFGSQITYVPEIGASSTIISVFRETPVEVLSGDGVPIIVTRPTWAVPADRAAGVTGGGHILAPNGRRYRVQNKWPSGSPAADATVIYALEELQP